MKEVVLHIGMHKTGTSAIQSSLREYESNGIKYASFSEENHSIPFYTIFSKNRNNYHIWRKRGLNPSAILAEKQAYHDILLKDLSDPNVDRLIFSGEDMSSLSHSEQANVATFFLEKQCSVKVILVVRDPFSYATSATQQMIKGGHKDLGRINPSYQQKLSGFSEVLPVECIRVYDYADLIAGDGLMTNFGNILGVTLQDQGKVNESMSLEALAIILQLNRLPIKTSGSQTRFVARNTIVNMCISFFSIDKGFEKLAGYRDASLLVETAYQDCEWLYDTYGIDYRPLFESPDDSSLKERLDGSVVRCVDHMPDFFKQLGCEFRKELGVEANLENAFNFVYRSLLTNNVKKPFLKRVYSAILSRKK